MVKEKDKVTITKSDLIRAYAEVTADYKLSKGFSPGFAFALVLRDASIIADLVEILFGEEN